MLAKNTYLKMQEYTTGSRTGFIQSCQAGEFDGVEAIYRSNESTAVRILPCANEFNIFTDFVLYR
jgi:hypothetical protein